MASYTITIGGGLPGLNEYIDVERTSRYMAADMKRSVQEAFIRYHWIEPNKRRDPSNIAFAKKFIEDALVDIGIIQNDGWRHVAGFSDSFSVDKDNPRVEVTIEEVD